MLKNRKHLGFIAISVVMLFFLIYMGPVDGFTHGFFSEETDVSLIYDQGWSHAIDLSNGYEMTFSPKKNNLCGFSIFLWNNPDGNTGTLKMDVFNEQGVQIDEILVNLAKVHDLSWYKVYSNAKFKKGSKYDLKFHIEGANIVPYLQTVDKDYLPSESVEGDILIAYAYEKSTFTFQNKILIAIITVGIWLFIVSWILKNKKLGVAAFFVFFVGTLSWNYMYNSIDNQNTTFPGFQEDSETLVTGTIYAEEDEEYFRGDAERGYGLGRYYDLKGALFGYGSTYITDDNWVNGYSRTECSIVVNSNSYSKEVAVPGNTIQFNNGDKFQIKDINDDESNIILYLNGSFPLSPIKYGSLDDAIFIDVNGNCLHKSFIISYQSQYGLQGKIFRHIARWMNPDEELNSLNLICSILTAFVFVLIVFLIYKKYNCIFAACFMYTFFLSPWIVNFARNLYWVEFTWFLPMVFGLLCSWQVDNKKIRLICYFGSFATILIKSLCGYEYISVVMMGLILFPLVDLSCAIYKKNSESVKLIIRTIILLGIFALIGFFSAMCIHATLKGQGDILEGIKIIFENDARRRIGGIDLNDCIGLLGREWEALTASHWDTLRNYFHFSTEVVTGISGNLFSLLCVVPLGVFLIEFRQQKLNAEHFFLYIFSLLTSMSWFYLARDHSYVHVHMNYVLWYFGFVQVCFYIIIDKIVSAFRNVEKNNLEKGK